MVPSSIGQDARFSSWKAGFDSPWDYKMIITSCHKCHKDIYIDLTKKLTHYQSGLNPICHKCHYLTKNDIRNHKINSILRNRFWARLFEIFTKKC